MKNQPKYAPGQGTLWTIMQIGGVKMVTVLWIITGFVFIVVTFLVSILLKEKKHTHAFLLIIIGLCSITLLAVGNVWLTTHSSISMQDEKKDHNDKPGDSEDPPEYEGEPDNKDNEQTPVDEGNGNEDGNQSDGDNNEGKNPDEDGLNGNDNPNEDSDGEKPPEQDSPNPSSMDDYYDKVSKIYTVQSGDTLWKISQHFTVSVQEIKYWNKLPDDKIIVGQKINLSGPPIPIEEPIIKPEPKPSPGPSALINKGNSNQKEIALTFDAGSDIAGIRILDVLKKHGVKSTFFLTGKFVEKFPDQAKKIVAEGHEIANHSYGHEDFTQISHEARLQSIQKTENVIQNILGIHKKTYFRFPYGASNQSALKSVGEAGYRYSIHWSIDTIDWQQPEASMIVERILSKASNGAIVLMHIGGNNTPEAVDQVLPLLKEQGYKIVTVSEVLN